MKGITQRIVNIFDIGENSNVTIIKGCSSIVPEGAHQALTILKARGNNRITNLMIHNWAPYITVSSKTYTFLGDNVKYNGYYVKISPVKAIGLGSEYYLGKYSIVEYNEATLAHKNTRITSNTRIVLKGRGSGGIITSRGVVNRGYMDVNPLIRAEADDTRGHIECSGLLIEDGVYKTHPSLETTVEDSYLTHEASIGKISGDQLFYLQTRGLTEDDATRLIVLGFLTSVLKGLPSDLRRYMNETMKYFVVKDRRFL
jgi:Fe-S cluster assembly scaffold protein SufB